MLFSSALRKYDIRPQTIRVGNKVCRGFPNVCGECRETLFQIANVVSRSSHLYASLRPLREQAQRRSRCIGGFVPGNPGKTLLHRRWSCHIRPVFCGPERFAESSPGDRPTASRSWRSNVVIWRSRSASASALVLKNFRPRLKGRRSRY